MKSNRALTAALLAAAIPTSGAIAAASPSPAELCVLAAVDAARSTNVPEEVLHAIAQVETGRRTAQGFGPWPWAINAGGTGHWLPSRDVAEAFGRRLFDSGIESFDLGCFQINYRWHRAGFESMEQMLDPHRNAQYAARFLSRLHRELGTWEAATGAYHSRSEELAAAYAARVQAAMRRPQHSAAARHLRMDPGERTPLSHQRPIRPLQSRARHGALGSLVPADAATAPGSMIVQAGRH